MTRPGVEIDGAKELRRQLRVFQSGIDGLKEIHRDAAELVGERAAELVPVRSGLLRSTIRASGQAAGAVVRAGYGRVPYAAPIHFGWPRRGIRPTPFLYDAADHRRQEVIDLYEERVADLKREYGLD